MKNLLITLIFFSFSKLSFGQFPDTMVLALNQNYCGEAFFDLNYYFNTNDSITFHVDFGNNTDSLVTTEYTSSSFIPQQFSSIYVYSGNYTIDVTAETSSGAFLDHQTYNFAIIGGEGCSTETIYKITNNFSGSYYLSDTIPMDFTGSDGMTHTIYPTNFPNNYLTNPFLYPAQITANQAWLAAHNQVQLNPPIHFSAPTMILLEDMYFGIGWPALIISRTDVANINNLVTLSPSSSFVFDQQENDCYLHLNNTTNAIPDSIKRIRVEYDPFLQVSHPTLLNLTEGVGFFEFDVERLNLYQPIHFGLTASSVVSLDSLYFRCFYLNNADQNAQDDTTSIFFESVDPCAVFTGSVLNVSLDYSELIKASSHVNSQVTLSKNLCIAVDSLEFTVHHSAFLELDTTILDPFFQFNQLNDTTLKALIAIPQYSPNYVIQLIFKLTDLPTGLTYVNYSINLPDDNLNDNLIGDTIMIQACDSIDFGIASLSAVMVAPIQAGKCNISPLILASCYVTDTTEILITFPSYVTVDSSALVYGTFIDSTFHLLVDWTNQNAYFQLLFHIPGSIPSGTPYIITAKVVNSNDIDSTNNESSYQGIVLNSYDPNEKHTDLPTNLDPDLQEKITYTIHFQNDGNLEAYNIVVRDTLSANLDLSTFQFLGASHHCEVIVDENTREVVFNFPYIMLASSELDSLGSQGIFSYQISENANLPEGSIIENTAYIYFDFNPAIITNTTYNINHLPLGLTESKTELIGLYPNPAQDKIQFSGATVNQVLIYDLAGKVVLESNNILNNEVSLNHIQTGIYQVVLKTENSISNQKLIIKK
jgi:uncharacterized repeat protein (TIGR01451 family)